MGPWNPKAARGASARELAMRAPARASTRHLARTRGRRAPCDGRACRAPARSSSPLALGLHSCDATPNSEFTHTHSATASARPSLSRTLAVSRRGASSDSWELHCAHDPIGMMQD
ncbi:hypothetical protein BC628DRAFT_1383705 [Trametes gibbosa]|nr:hypothetical protein BC628DRAFT_1383705 [Trametes gibbosa]